MTEYIRIIGLPIEVEGLDHLWTRKLYKDFFNAYGKVILVRRAPRSREKILGEPTLEVSMHGDAAKILSLLSGTETFKEYSLYSTVDTIKLTPIIVLKRANFEGGCKNGQAN